MRFLCEVIEDVSTPGPPPDQRQAFDRRCPTLVLRGLQHGPGGIRHLDHHRRVAGASGVAGVVGPASSRLTPTVASEVSYPAALVNSRAAVNPVSGSTPVGFGHAMAPGLGLVGVPGDGIHGRDHPVR